MVKILVIGDLHGVKPKIYFKDFDYVILPGDICADKGFGPMFKKWFKLLAKMGEEAPSPDQLMEEMYGKGAEEKFDKINLDAGRVVLEHLNSFEKPIFFIPGNWDQSFGKTRIKDSSKSDYNRIKSVMDKWFNLRSNKKLLEGFENIYDMQFGMYSSDDFNLMGYGLTNNVDDFASSIKKGEMSVEKKKELLSKFYDIKKRLNNLWKKRNKKVVSIVCSHNMPYGVMDKSLIKGSYAYKKSLGSKVIREFCLKKKPEICIGGHIHEYHGKKKLGKTTVINAGFGRNVNTLIDINEKTGKIRSIKFWNGKK